MGSLKLKLIHKKGNISFLVLVSFSFFKEAWAWLMLALVLIT